MPRQIVFISGGTGYMGRPLVNYLLTRGHEVRVLSRKESLSRVPSEAIPVPGNALDAASFGDSVKGADTFVHLTGVAHPAPWKDREFRAIDQASLEASAKAAQNAGVRHFVYVSVAGPAPIMREYIQIRRECEQTLARTGIPRTILRPWYVLGPGHWWPYLLKPFYWMAAKSDAWREGAERLGLVTHTEMVNALSWAVENPSQEVRILNVPEIRRASSLRL